VSPRLASRRSRSRAPSRGKADLAERLRRCEPALSSRARGRAALLSILSAVSGTIEPAEISTLAIGFVSSWLPAPSWAVITSDVSGQPWVLAERGIAPEMALVLPFIAARTLRDGGVFGAGSLRLETGIGATFDGSVIALPLMRRDTAFGAIIGLDPLPSARPPRLSSAAARALGVLMAPIADALDKALRLNRAEALSVTDDLTHLYNARYLHQVLRRETKRAARSGRPLSLLFVDLDGFKLINDTYGHLAGSRALVEAAAVIRGSARETDVVARFGGDEFALILPDTGGLGALAVAERVCDRIASHRFLAESGLNLRLTASIGVATRPEAAGSPDELVQAADSAMYKVKDRGKNGIQVAPVLTDM
jgi:diguanylate cyclase (GGDEF)-like protein